MQAIPGQLKSGNTSCLCQMTDTEDEWDECEVEFNLGEVECRQGRDIRPGRVFCSPKSSSFPPKNYLGEVECEAEKSQAATARERSAHGWRTHIIWTKYSQNGKKLKKNRI